ncbi:MAG TPA: hypothetical protein VMK12_17690 [Anaeromyxobacteraceae bacterium]|nr:hypothetical protein [Anaeromyxobacteraceae bacterium]
MTGLYVETSALLRVILEGDESLRPHLLGKSRYSSAATFAEARRAIVRAIKAVRLDASGARQAMQRIAEFERFCDVVSIDDAVLERVGREFPVEPMRTIDAIHLAAALALSAVGIDVTILSVDDRVRENAKALGFVLLPG